MVTLAFAGSGCATSSTAHYDPVERRLCGGGGSRGCYKLGPLDGDWQLARGEGAALAFVNSSTNAVIESNITCREDSEAASLESLTEHMLIGYTAREFVSSELTQLEGRDATHSVVTAKLDGVPVELSLYVAKRNGCIIDLSYVARPSLFDAGQPAFARFVSGFVDENKL